MKSLYNLVFYLLCGNAAFVGLVFSQLRNGSGGEIPITRFTCQGRPMGYYADVETGCQVYHMCDGMGRQFSYRCPNTTLFQQRMLICDHWYMVNCSKSESEYSANLLIGQRDKPFVSEQEMHTRTPRPDILTVPYNQNFYDGLKQAETKYPAHSINSIATGPGESGADGSLDTGKTQFTQSSHNVQQQGVSNDIENHIVSSTPRFNPNRQDTFSSSTLRSTDQGSEEYDLDIRMKAESRPSSATYNFIKRFDPNSQPTPTNTAMTKNQILDVNLQLPLSSDVSSEDVSVSRKSTNSPNNFNKLDSHNGKTGSVQSGRRTANNKSPNNFGQDATGISQIAEPHRELQLPKSSYSKIPSTTMGPPIYYEWKWAVPAFDLEPPKLENSTANSIDSTLQASESGRNTFRNVSRSSTATPRSLENTSESSKTVGPDYEPGSYFVPDYIFPLDGPHPGYQEAGALTSFQVSLPDKGKSYGENPNCPQCHPAYVKPGTCQPCIVKR